MFQGGFGDRGGGFMNAPSAFAASQDGPSQPEKRARHRVDSIIPCSVAQVLRSTQDGDKLFLGPIELFQVSVVGLIRSVRHNTTHMDYVLDDMTGPLLDIKYFIETDGSAPVEKMAIPVRENMYVRATGHLRVFDSKRNMTAFKITALTDMNELTTHMLEIIYSHMSLTKQHAGTSTGQQPMGFGAPAPAAVIPFGSYQGVNQGLTPVQQQVYNVIKTVRDESGISRADIDNSLRGLPNKAITDAIEFLSSEGHIYSTINDDWYRSTDS